MTNLNRPQQRSITFHDKHGNTYCLTQIQQVENDGSAFQPQRTLSAREYRQLRDARRADQARTLSVKILVGAGVAVGCIALIAFGAVLKQPTEPTPVATPVPSPVFLPPPSPTHVINPNCWIGCAGGSN